MRGYIIRRLLLFIPTFFLCSIILFILLRMIPGDVIDLMLAAQEDMSGSAEAAALTEERLRHQLGLDVPIFVQYGRWLGVYPQDTGEFKGLFQFDLGESLWKRDSVTELIVSRLPITVELSLLSMTTAWLIALPIGITSAIRQDTIFDYGSRSFAIVWVAAPNFWLATMVVVYPSIWWGWSPPIVYIPFAENAAGNLLQFILPAIIMGTSMSGGTARYTRTLMLEVLRQDYIRTAWAKGLRERTVIMRHAMRNALIPLVTIIGFGIPGLVAGSVIMEQIFCLPGTGRLMLEALNSRDYPIVSGINMMAISLVLFANLLVDILYGYLDPRIRYT
jgi:peptide/nickel transport system permease protein